MALDTLVRTPGTGETHRTITPAVGTLAGIKAQVTAIGADNLDLGGNAAGSVLNAAGALGARALGGFLPCEGRSRMIFAVAYSVTADPLTRRFRVVARDFNTTVGNLILPGLYEPANLMLNASTSPALTCLAGTGYYCAEAIVVPCLGLKTMTLLLEPGDVADPTVHAWGAAI